jgi:hypothetical protein
VSQGWFGDDYLILFTDSESSLAADSYGISQVFPGFKVIGLRGWDDFILQDAKGSTYSVPTVPAIPMHLLPYALPVAGSTLVPDDRYHNKNQMVRQASGVRGRSAVGHERRLGQPRRARQTREVLERPLPFYKKPMSAMADVSTTSPFQSNFSGFSRRRSFTNSSTDESNLLMNMS